MDRSVFVAFDRCNAVQLALLSLSGCTRRAEVRRESVTISLAGTRRLALAVCSCAP